MSHTRFARNNQWHHCMDDELLGADAEELDLSAELDDEEMEDEDEDGDEAEKEDEEDLGM